MFPNTYFAPRYFAPDYFAEFGLTSVASRIPRINNLPAVYIAQPSWPGRMIADLSSASGVDYAWVQGDPRSGVFTVAENDPALNRDVRQPGSRVVFQWDPFDPWVGYLVAIEKSHSTGLIEMTALDCLEILAGRVTPQSLVYSSPVASSVIIRYLLDVANESDTGIRAGNIELGPSVDEIELGGQSVLDAMREVCERTGYQIWVTSTVTPNNIITLLHYGRRQGDDHRHRMHLYEGVHFSESRSKLDVTQMVQSRTFIGDFGMEVHERQSVTRTSLPVGATSARTRRITNLLAGSRLSDLPPGLRNESVQFEVMTSNLAELDRRAEHEQEQMLEQQAQYDDVIALPSLTDDQLTWLKVGTVWTRHATFDEEIEDVVRIVSLQANPEGGLAQISSVAVLR